MSDYQNDLIANFDNAALSIDINKHYFSKKLDNLKLSLNAMRAFTDRKDNINLENDIQNNLFVLIQTYCHENFHVYQTLHIPIMSMYTTKAREKIENDFYLLNIAVLDGYKFKSKEKIITCLNKIEIDDFTKQELLNLEKEFDVLDESFHRNNDDCNLSVYDLVEAIAFNFQLTVTKDLKQEVFPEVNEEYTKAYDYFKDHITINDETFVSRYIFVLISNIAMLCGGKDISNIFKNFKFLCEKSDNYLSSLLEDIDNEFFRLKSEYAVYDDVNRFYDDFVSSGDDQVILFRTLCNIYNQIINDISTLPSASIFHLKYKYPYEDKKIIAIKNQISNKISIYDNVYYLCYLMASDSGAHEFMKINLDMGDTYYSDVLKIKLTFREDSEIIKMLEDFEYFLEGREVYCCDEDEVITNQKELIECKNGNSFNKKFHFNRCLELKDIIDLEDFEIRNIKQKEIKIPRQNPLSGVKKCSSFEYNQSLYDHKYYVPNRCFSCIFYEDTEDLNGIEDNIIDCKKVGKVYSADGCDRYTPDITAECSSCWNYKLKTKKIIRKIEIGWNKPECVACGNDVVNNEICKRTNQLGYSCFTCGAKGHVALDASPYTQLCN